MLNKKISYAKTSLKKVDLLADENATAVSCYVFNGKLKKGLIARRLTYSGNVPKNCFAVFPSSNGKLFVCNGTVYVCDLSGAGEFVEVGLSGVSKCYFTEYFKNGTVCVGIGYNRTFYEYLSGTLTKYTLPYSAQCAVYHCGRLFFIDGKSQRVFWTGIGGVSNVELSLYNSGSLDLSDGKLGEILRIIPMDGKLILARENGFSVMRAYGDPENFKVDSLFFYTGKVNPSSLALCGEKLCFLTDSGLYSFNGSTVEKHELFPDGIVKNVRFSCGVNDKYFLSCYCEKLQKEGVICFNLALKTHYYIDVFAQTLHGADSAYLINGDGAFRLEEPEEFCGEYTTSKIDFSTRKNKALRFICIEGANRGIITVQSDISQRVFAADRNVKANVSGTWFTVKLSGDCSANKAIAVAEA
ncbi:MAG: hypothetical protein J6B04_02445 [Clostridia bacterium]|nr:hypothetical protein [Clostridia bacterium]